MLLGESISKLDNKMKTERMIYQVDETRDKILEVAEKMFIEKGFDATKMKDLADEIEISRTSLYRYFRDKFDLSFAIVEVLLRDIWATNEKIASSLEILPTALEKIEALLRAKWLSEDKVLAYRFLAEFDAHYSGSRINEDFRAKMVDTLQENVQDGLLISYLEEGIADGSIRSDIPVRLLSAIIVNGLRAMHQRIVLRGNVLVEFEQNELDSILDIFVNMLLQGIEKH